MNGPDSDAFDLLERLTEDFSGRLRRGERPRIEDYVAAHPQLADDVRRLLGLVEKLHGHPEVEPTMPPATPQPPPPQRVGGYRLIGELGRGGMGVVYEAEQEALGRRVALKVLSRGHADAASLERFRREAAACALLHHGNVVPVFEAGQDGDFCYYAMQLIRGRTLAQVVQAQLQARQAAGSSSGHGPGDATAALTPAEAASLRAAVGAENLNRGRPAAAAGEGGPCLDHRARAALILQAARGLAYAHSRGMVHRDVKPSNLLLGDDGVVWVSDFGLVKVGDSDLTQTGSVVGTLRYLPPETLRGQCDRRSDVYSLGLTLYELLTLRPAFDGSGQQVLDAIHSREPARPRSIDPTIPHDLETICLKAAAKDPASRYQSADDFAEDLRRYLAGEPIQARPPGPLVRLAMWARRDPVVASLAAAVMLSLLLGLAFTLAFAIRANENADLAARRERQANDALADVTRERDAKAASLRRAEGLRLLAQSENVRGRDPGLALLLAARGARLAPGLVAAVAVQEALEDCHELRTFVGHKGAVYSAAFSADGRKALTCGEDGTARLWDVTTGKQLLTVAAADLRQAFLSPDGARIVALSGAAVFSYCIPGNVVTSRPDGRGRARPVVRLFDARSGKLVSQWRPPGPARPFAAYPAAGASFSPDGKRVLTFFAIDGPGMAAVHDLATGKVVDVIDAPHPVFAAAYSPVGPTVATADGDGAVRLRDARGPGKVLHALRGHRCDVAALAFSRDGARLLTAGSGKKFGSRAGVPTLDDVPDDAAGRVWQVASGKLLAALEWPDESRAAPLAGRFLIDGRHVCLADSTRGRRLWDLTTGKPSTVLPTANLPFHPNPIRSAVVIGSDGSRVAFCGWDGAVRVLLWADVVTMCGHQARANSVAFSPDERRLLTASYDGTARLWAAPRPFISNGANGGQWATASSLLSPDGSRLLIRPASGPGAELIDTATGERTARLGAFLWDALLSGDGRKVVAVGGENHARELITLDLAAGRSVSKPLHEGRLVALSHDGALALLDLRDPARPAGGHGALLIWDVAAGKRLARLEAPAGAMVPVASFSPDGGKRLLLGWARSLAALPGPAQQVIDVATGRELWRTAEVAGGPRWAAFCCGGREVVTLHDGDVVLRTFDAATGEPRRTCEARGPGKAVRLSAGATRLRARGLVCRDGKRVLLSHRAGAVGVWDLTKGGGPALLLRGHEGAVTFCGFSRDGKSILTGGEDRTARLWDAASGARVGVFAGHDGPVRCAALDAAGRRLVTASDAVRVFDVAAGQQLARLRWDSRVPIDELAFAPGGRRVCARGGLMARLWRLDVLAAAEARLPRALTAEERRRYEVPEAD